MARRSSPKDPSVSQTYDTSCSWRLYRMFNFREGQAKRRLVSSRRHSNVHAIGNGNSESRPDVLSMVDEKYPHYHIDVSSKRTRDYGCKSISCVKNDQVAAVQGNEATEMVVDQNFINGKYLYKDGAGSHPHQFFDALQILYSKKELFLKLLQDPNSLLVKQIYDLQISQVNEQYQAGQKMLTRSAYESRWINSHENYATQRETAYAGCHLPLHSHDTCSYNEQTAKPSYFPFSHIKRKLRHAMRVKKKEQEWGTSEGGSRKFPCGCQALEDGNKVTRLESVGRNSISSDHSGFAKAAELSLKSKTRDKKKKKIRDFTLCIGQGAVSVGESRGRNITRTSVSPSEQNIQNIYVEATKNLSEILNCRIEETNIDEPPGAIAKTLNNQLHSFGTNILHADYGIPIGSEKLIRCGCDLHPREIRHMDVPSEQDTRPMDSPPQSFDMDITAERIGSAMDSPQDIQDPSSEVASSSSSSSQSVDDPVKMRNRIEDHHSTESFLQQFIWEEVTNPPCTISQPAEFPVQLVHDKFEEHHFADLTRSSSDPINSLITSIDMSEPESDYNRGILQMLSLKWDELVMKCGSPDQLLDPSTFKELKGLTLCGSTILFDCVKEVFMEIYQNFCRFPPQCSIIKSNVQAYVLKRTMVNEVEEVINLHHHQHQSPRTLEEIAEKDLARRGSWLIIQVDTEDIAVEVGEDVLRTLILEIVSEMNIRSEA